MSQDNPFAKLGALDQMLYQETSPKQGENKDDRTSDKKPKEKSEVDNLGSMRFPVKVTR